MSIWLASGSPRRATLLGWAGFDVDVHPPDVDETRRRGEAPLPYARRLAAEKVGTAPDDRLALAADTVVHRSEILFDKPADRAAARDTLRALSGRWHQVSTAVAIRQGSRIDAFSVTTKVRFRPLDDAEIDGYLETGEADDKAGAYGIQGRAAVFVAEVRGSWTNVVGLPMEQVVPRLRAWESA